MKTIHKFICCAALALGLGACTNEDYPLYDTGQKDTVFFDYYDEKNEPVVSVDYNFGYNPAEFYDIDIPLTLMGMPSTKERQIALAPVKDETTMEEGKHYVIESLVLPANAIHTKAKIRLLRKDPVLQTKQLKLTLELGENEDLRSVGQKRFTITFSDIRPTECPEWWSQDAWTPFPVYSFENAQLFFKYFYERAPKADQDIFNEMIAKYGDYFMYAKKTLGPYAMYRTFLIRYVLVPLYEEHPEIEWQKVPEL